MGDNSRIAWTDATWNPVVGCTKVSEGCKYCYAERDHTKRHKAFLEGKLQNIPQYAQPFSKIQLLEERLQQPLKWKRPRKIFVNSLSDLFHEDVPCSFIEKVFNVMGNCQNHIFQILTKRPKRMLEFTKLYYVNDTKAFRNVWLGVTAENQEAADHRIPLLSQVPAAVRFISVEPMLGPINFIKECECLEPIIGSWSDIPIGRNVPYGFSEKYSADRACPKCKGTGRTNLLKDIHLVICGGESGPNARPLHPGNVRSLRNQCTAAGVKFFFKQWGEWNEVETVKTQRELAQKCNSGEWAFVDVSGKSFVYTTMNSTLMQRVGTRKAGCLLDGREWKELPEVAA